MAQPTYEYSGVCYTATSGQTTFALTSTAGNPIGYLSPSHIHVRTSANSGETWIPLPVDTAWNFADPATSIVLVTPATAGVWVDIQRKTPIDKDWIDFQAGSLLTAGQLNEAETFSLYCDQEIVDGIRDGELAPVDPGVTKLIAGDNITLSPSSGVGEVTIGSTGSATGGIVYKGTIDATQTVPDVFTNGDFWINTVAGNAAAGWTGLDSQAIAVGERLIYDGTEWETLPMPPGSTVSSVNGQIGAVEIGVEQLTDFAYYPSSNLVTLLGPQVSPSGQILEGTEFSGEPDQGASYFRFRKDTNLPFFNGVSQLDDGDPIDLTWNNAGTMRTDSVPFLGLSESQQTSPTGDWTLCMIAVGSPLGTMATGDYYLSVYSPLITNGEEPIRTGQTLIYDQTTEKWRPQVPQVKVEELADFAYYPASQQVTLVGPNVADLSAPSVTDANYNAYPAAAVGPGLWILWRNTNTAQNEIFEPLVEGNELTCCYYVQDQQTGEPVYVEVAGTFFNFGPNTGSSPPEAYLQINNAADSGYAAMPTPLYGDYPFVIKSPFINNGFAPITTGQALIYDQTTEKWRPGDIASELNISALPALP